jgi:gluconate 2-dehydrogenase gamma chain
MDMISNRRGVMVGLGGLAALWAVPSVTMAQGAPPAVLTWTPKALTPAQARALDAAAEVIMPATDVPGAREAGVPAFVDRAVAIYLPPDQAQAIRSGLDRMDADARAVGAANFASLRAEQQSVLLARYESESRTPNATPQAVGRGDTETGLSNRTAAVAAAPKGFPFFPILREMVTVGYFTSQLGATKAVRYDPVPGAYHGCVPLAQIGRAWAL